MKLAIKYAFVSDSTNRNVILAYLILIHIDRYFTKQKLGIF